jgi:hypothetical protein
LNYYTVLLSVLPCILNTEFYASHSKIAGFIMEDQLIRQPYVEWRCLTSCSSLRKLNRRLRSTCHICLCVFPFQILNHLNDFQERQEFHICVSVHHQSIILINQLDATLCSLIYSLLRFTIHVSGAFCTHHQEYN